MYGFSIVTFSISYGKYNNEHLVNYHLNLVDKCEIKGR